MGGSFVVVLVLVFGEGVYEVQRKALLWGWLLLELLKGLWDNSRYVVWLFLAGLGLLSLRGWLLGYLLHFSLNLLLPCSRFLLYFPLRSHSPRNLFPSHKILLPFFFHPLPILKLPNPNLQLIDIEQLLTNLLIVVPPYKLNILLPLVLDDISLVHRQEFLLLWIALLAE